MSASDLISTEGATAPIVGNGSASLPY